MSRINTSTASHIDRKFRDRISMAACASLFAVSFALAYPVPSAQATAAQCEGGANGFIDIPDNLRGTHAPPAKWNPRRVDNRPGQRQVYAHLYYGTVSGAQRGWAMIDGQTVPGDWVWMDYSTDGGESVRIRCGPFKVSDQNRTKTSAAKTTSRSSSVKFRACAQMYNTPATSARCTEWW
jgi:hypothetical protein